MALLAAAGPPEGQRAKPNIVLILVDDLGYGDLGYTGSARVRTPNIDRLAASGIRFDSFYANSSVCSPTRAALLTGRYPDLVGVPGVIRDNPKESFGRLDPGVPLLPSVLKQAGYHTALVGKWHLGLAEPSTPNSRGFDHFHGFLDGMMNDYQTHMSGGQNFMRLNREPTTEKGHATDLFTKWAVDYVRDRATKAMPFFLMVAYTAPHQPIQPPADWLARVRSEAPELGIKEAKLVALIEHLDDNVGSLLASLRELRQEDHTLVLFLSDNGGDLAAGASNKPWRAGKSSLYEGGIRVPMCAVWPGHIAPGSRTERIGLSMDLFATLVEVAGAASPGQMDARSLLPTLLGRPQPADDRTLIWVFREGGREQGEATYAVRRGEWKLISGGPGKVEELYNLREDPREEINLLRPGERRPPIADELKQAALDHIARARSVPWHSTMSAPLPGYSDRTKRQLRR